VVGSASPFVSAVAAALAMPQTGDILAHGSSPLPDVLLNTGARMPMIAVGTGGLHLHDASTSQALEMALRMGHRAVDTSEAYASFDSIGAVLEKFPRDSYFLTSKVDPTRRPRGSAFATRRTQCVRDAGGCAELVEAVVTTSLATLRTSHIDLLLLHRTPHRVRDDPKAQCAMLRGLWRGLEAARSAGHARAIGVSNCCGSCMRCLLETPGATVPAVWQQMHHVGMGDDPYGYISWARSKGIVYMAYSVLGGVVGDIGKIGASSAVRDAAAAAGSGPQVALEWVAQQRLPFVALSGSARHIASNLQLGNASSWRLTAEQMRALSASRTPPGRPSRFSDCPDEQISGKGGLQAGPK
jgi:diketogulonate reductase-like aldo/keto reductase